MPDKNESELDWTSPDKNVELYAGDSFAYEVVLGPRV